MERFPGATRGAARAAERAFGISPPADYLDFMLEGDGEERPLGERWVHVRPVEGLVYFNEGYEIRENAPGLVLFGANGGLEPFGFSTRDKRMGVVMRPFMPMELEAAMCCGSNLAEFLENPRRGDCSPSGEER